MSKRAAVDEDGPGPADALDVVVIKSRLTRIGVGEEIGDDAVVKGAVAGDDGDNDLCFAAAAAVVFALPRPPRHDNQPIREEEEDVDVADEDPDADPPPPLTAAPRERFLSLLPLPLPLASSAAANLIRGLDPEAELVDEPVPTAAAGLPPSLLLLPLEV